MTIEDNRHGSKRTLDAVHVDSSLEAIRVNASVNGRSSTRFFGCKEGVVQSCEWIVSASVPIEGELGSCGI